MDTGKRILVELAGGYAICRLPADSAVPDWCWQGEFCSLTRTQEEVSIICRESLVPTEQGPDLKVELGWRMFRVAGQLDFSLTGVIAGISSVLATAGLGIFMLSTFDTDYILVKKEDFVSAGTVLRLAGYRIKAEEENS